MILTNWWRWGWCWPFDAVSSWILAITDTWRPMERGQYWDLVSSSLVVISQVSSWSQSHKAILDNFLNILGFYLARGEATGWEAISKGGESWTQPLQVPNWKSVLEKKQYNNTIRIFLTMRFPGYPCNNLGKFWTNRVYSSEKPRLDGGLTRLEDNPISICPENQDWACGQGLYWIQWLHLIAWRVFVHDYWIVETILIFTSIFVEMGGILYLYPLFFFIFFFGPESDHHLPFQELANSLTHCCSPFIYYMFHGISGYFSAEKWLLKFHKK